MNTKRKYIFVHGTAGWGSYDARYEKMPYWGMRGGDLISYLREKGFDCYAASVSPVGSAWDRACELYAQICGSRVDYGQYHSRHYSHERYGKDYAGCPLLPDWSENTELVLIGHSFGGATVRLFAELMAHGDEAERSDTKEEDLSPFFVGGKGHQIVAVVGLAAEYNGNSAYDMTSDSGFDLKAVRVPWWSKLFGRAMTRRIEPQTDGRDPEDCGDYDMHIDRAILMNRRMSALPDVYYFSVPCSYTRKKGDRYVPEKGMEPFFVMRSLQMGQYTSTTAGGMKIDHRWLRNDGRVNTISEVAPFGSPRKKLDPDHPQPGVWNVYPIYHGDHMSLQGGLLHKRDIRPFYEEMLAMIGRIPSSVQNLKP